jgi:hypothetical protein
MSAPDSAVSKRLMDILHDSDTRGIGIRMTRSGPVHSRLARAHWHLRSASSARIGALPGAEFAIDRGLARERARPAGVSDRVTSRSPDRPTSPAPLPTRRSAAAFHKSRISTSPAASCRRSTGGSASPAPGSARSSGRRRAAYVAAPGPRRGEAWPRYGPLLHEQRAPCHGGVSTAPASPERRLAPRVQRTLTDAGARHSGWSSCGRDGCHPPR